LDLNLMTRTLGRLVLAQGSCWCSRCNISLVHNSRGRPLTTVPAAGW
jgi:hypothetical protein